MIELKLEAFEKEAEEHLRAWLKMGLTRMILSLVFIIIATAALILELVFKREAQLWSIVWDIFMFASLVCLANAQRYAGLTRGYVTALKDMAKV